MESNEIKQRLSTNDVIRFMEYFGADIGVETEEYITFRSICHNSDSYKIYYYTQTKSWNCFVCGGSVDLFTIAQQELGLTFQESIKWVENFFDLGEQRGFGRNFYTLPQREIINKPIDITEQLPGYNETILNTFINYQAAEWINEGISEEIMRQFEIKFCINNNCIVIPCRDYNNRLVGIRCRNLDKETIERTGKYIVYTDRLNGIMYSCPTGRILYGLNINKDYIQQTKSIIIAESEKSVMLSNTWYGNKSVCVGSYGSNLTNFQLELIKSLGVERILFLYDKEEDEKILKKMNNVYKKCALMFDTYYIKDYGDLIDLKESPFDRGKETYEEILKRKIKYRLE